MKMQKCTIIGAGNGGQAMACYLALQGCRVKIFDVNASTIQALQSKGEIQLEGAVEGSAKIALATTDIKEAIAGSEVIFIILPSIYHRSIAQQLATYLEDGQFVIQSPNATLGPIEFAKTLEDCGCTADVSLGAICNLLFACRLVEVGKVHIFGKKKYLSAAAYPSSKNSIMREKIGEYFPEYHFVEDVIHVGLDNMNAFVHPAPTILNSGRIESGIPFQYYIDGMTPTVATYVEKLDAERQMIAKAYDVKIETIPELYHLMYETKGTTIEETVRNCEGYRGVMAETKVKTRYVLEDIPYSMVALQTLASIANLEVPAIDTIISMAHLLFEDSLDEGRTAKNLGLSGYTRDMLLKKCRG